MPTQAGATGPAAKPAATQDTARFTRRTETWSLTSNPALRRLQCEVVQLPDGRVFVGGGGQPAADGETDNFNAQLLSPPYLFKSDGTPADRPQIQDAPATVAYGQTFDVKTSQPGAVARVTLVKLGSMTHAFNQSQRFIRLAFAAGPGAVTATAPANANLAPPGHYLLFLVGTNGAPSVARIVHIG